MQDQFRTGPQSAPHASQTGQPDAAGRRGDSGDDLRRAAADVRDAVRDEVTSTAAEMRDQIAGMAEPLQEKAVSLVEERKAAGAARIGGIARAIDQAAGELDEQLPQAAGYVRKAARQIESMSEAVRDKSVEDLMHDANRFARNNPAMFFGLTLAAGFAVARFLKAGTGGTDASGMRTGGQPAGARPQPHMTSPPLQPHPGQHAGAPDFDTRTAPERHSAFPASPSEI